jgi:hypothetical protein
VELRYLQGHSIKGSATKMRDALGIREVSHDKAGRHSPG